MGERIALKGVIKDELGNNHEVTSAKMRSSMDTGIIMDGGVLLLFFSHVKIKQLTEKVIY